MTNDEIATNVGLAVLYDTVSQRRDQIQALLTRHGLQPMDSDEDLVLQLVQLSNARGKFVDDDIMKETEAAGYFGAGLLASLAAKAGGAILPKVVQAVNILKNKTDADGQKIKLRDRLKTIFSKDKASKAPGGQVAPSQLDKDGEAAAKFAADGEDEEEEDKPVKKILGMPVPYFIGACVLFVIIVIVIIVLIMRHRKKKLAKKKED